MFDPNLNKIDYPAGVKPLDFLISSTEKERITETVSGIPGEIDYGYNLKSREATLKFQMEHYHDTHDFRLQRDKVYELFDTYPFMYVSEDKVPTRMIAITVDAAYTPERYGYWYSTLEIPARVTGLPYWRTKYTTKDIQNQGYQAIAEQFGMADGLNIDLTSYSYTTSTFSVWNGGNVAIDPRNMPLVITLYGVTSTNNFTVENLTTGEKFIAQRTLTDHTVTLQGTLFLLNNLNRLRECNRKFISLAPGENKIKISNGTFKKVDFEFPFFYK